jgi:hypothetical protein
MENPMAFRRTLSIALLTAWPLVAHHTPLAEFDFTRPVTLKGVVTRVEWINPHAWIYIDVKDAGGNVISWRVELASVNSLARKGVTKDSFKQAGETTIEVWLAKDGSMHAGATVGGTLTLPSGEKITGGYSLKPER